MKCPVCGHKVRPSKKYPGKYLCDTCRKRFPASAVIPDDTDTRSARSSAHKHGSVSGKKRPAARQQAFFDDNVTSPDHATNPKKKKKKHKKSLPFIILILILIIIAVVFLFSKMHTSSDNPSGTSTPKKTADATKEIYKQNETAAYNGIEITMDSYVESEGDDWSVPTEGNEFMFVHMTIVNQTSDDLVISSMASFENYCDDTKLDYSAAAFTALATTSDQPKLDGTIAPGETLEGYLSLEVPLNWSTVEIRYTDKIWSDDAVHFQIKRQE